MITSKRHCVAFVITLCSKKDCNLYIIRGEQMKNFDISKQIKKDFIGNEVLVITITQKLRKDQWKNRYLLFNSESTVFKKQKGLMK